MIAYDLLGQLVATLFQAVGNFIPSPPLVGQARRAVGHIDDAAVDESLANGQMAHGAVALMGVDAQMVMLLLGIVEGDVGDVGGAGSLGQPVYGGIGRRGVNPASMVDISVGGLDAGHQCEGADGFVVGDDEV